MLQETPELPPHMEVVALGLERITRVGIEDRLQLGAQRLVTEEIVDLDKRDPSSRAKMNSPRCERQVREISRGAAAPHAICQDTQVRKGGQVVLPKLRILERPGPRIPEQLLVEVDSD